MRKKALVVGRDLISAPTARALAKYQAWLARHPTPDLVEVQPDPREALPFSLPIRSVGGSWYLRLEGRNWKKPSTWKEWRGTQYWRLGR